MRTLTLFQAYHKATRDMMSLPEFRVKGIDGILVDKDKNALEYQRRDRQERKFRHVIEERLAKQ